MNTTFLKFAKCELRGGMKGFYVFLACLCIGVAAIAGIGSVSSAIDTGLAKDARKLLGGDVDLRLNHRPASELQIKWLSGEGRKLSHIVQMRAMAINSADDDKRRLVELKSVDGNYPLTGVVELEQNKSLLGLLGVKSSPWPAAVAKSLLNRLEMQVGDLLRIGDAKFQIAGILIKEPDPSTNAIELGPRIMISAEALSATGLVKPGSQLRYHYRISLPATETIPVFLDKLNAAFPDAGWRIRDALNAAPNIQTFLERVRMFLTLIGLTALLVGGVGIANAVKAFLDSRLETIATLKCLGATSKDITAIYLTVVMTMGVVGTTVGVLLGAFIPMLIAPLLAGKLPAELATGFYAEPLLLASSFGLLVTLLFSLWPLARAKTAPPAALFRDVLAHFPVKITSQILICFLILFAALAALAVLTADDRFLAVSFIIGAVGTFLLFKLAAWGVIKLAKLYPRPKGVHMRLALGNIIRPGAPAGTVILSLGLGLTVLSTISLVEGNLNHYLAKTLRAEAPGFFFIDIQPSQIKDYQILAASFVDADKSQEVPMLRGRITKLGDVPVADITPPPELAWILRGDRGLTWSRTPPSEANDIVAGKWWSEDYSGKPLVSFDEEAAHGFGLDVGDTITVNMLGREVVAEIANLRQIDWSNLGINFVMVFSPGLLEQAPQSYIATAYLPADQETALEKAVTDKFPNVSAIRMKEILKGVRDIVNSLGLAVQIIAGVAIATGVMVLAGVVAAGHRRRVYDSVVLKVLGATRRDVMLAQIGEFSIMGLATGLVAAAVGTLAAWLVVVYLMKAEWIFISQALVITLLLSVMIAALMGLIGTWIALGRKSVSLLRNE